MPPRASWQSGHGILALLSAAESFPAAAASRASPHSQQAAAGRGALSPQDDAALLDLIPRAAWGTPGGTGSPARLRAQQPPYPGSNLYLAATRAGKELDWAGGGVHAPVPRRPSVTQQPQPQQRGRAGAPPTVSWQSPGAAQQQAQAQQQRQRPVALGGFRTVGVPSTAGVYLGRRRRALSLPGSFVPDGIAAHLAAGELGAMLLI